MTKEPRAIIPRFSHNEIDHFSRIVTNLAEVIALRICSEPSINAATVQSFILDPPSELFSFHVEHSLDRSGGPLALPPVAIDAILHHAFRETLCGVLMLELALPLPDPENWTSGLHSIACATAHHRASQLRRRSRPFKPEGGAE